ncbi:unnamed protein product [Brachionus calyciflorus]|uniref:UPAR/Ly6 domain-containing protein n=1 Tax=Brachionus calyciflorus TaxID=104777 RepID=A0A814MU32_9BILA|nr:unnamed protein product [Brachionus calyciflorus]
MLKLRIAFIILSICVLKTWSLSCYSCADCSNLTSAVPTNLTIIECMGPNAQCSTSVFRAGNTDFVMKSCMNFCSQSTYEFPNMNALFLSSCCQTPLCNE